MPNKNPSHLNLWIFMQTLEWNTQAWHYNEMWELLYEHFDHPSQENLP